MTQIIHARVTLLLVLVFAAVTLTVLALISPAQTTDMTGETDEYVSIAQQSMQPPGPEEDEAAVYIVRAYEGYLAVFLPHAEMPFEITDTVISTLRRSDQLMLTKGVTITGDKNLAHFLEDFSY